MKYLNYLPIFSLFFLMSCGPQEKSVEEVLENGTQAEIEQKRKALNTTLLELKNKIKTLDDKLSEFEKDYAYALVEARELQPRTFKHYIKILGEATTDENILIYPEFSGNLQDIYISEGQEVKKGQKLAKIDDGGVSNQLAELKARRDLAKTRFERQKRLWDQNIGSEIQFLEAETAYEQLNNSVKQVESQLKKSVIYAPFNGKIDEIITDQGQVVSPGQTPIFRILNLGKMYISANVPENYVGSIEVGSEAMVSFGAINKTFKSEVVQVSSNISQNNRNFRVKVAIPDSIEFVKPNLIATIEINNYKTSGAIVIPEDILRENAQGQAFTFALAMENDSLGVAQFRELKLGKRYEGEIEVLEGLKASDIIVTEGARTIKKGEKVKVLNFQKN
ncbi:efflux RND transporter periplasmic adaptor subunit [Psychroflexus sp. YR1-1]|uniref:Efflux RND transporter periplasmic adaptor subunit n=1 Tax=Psychroflexus aurantiacus TaxID=2709310 RepID=A0A6B3R0T0_9FLAO|nr:efflux RND transporter periplasmic adaptor subunit [Psychroflexus aurantiacus]NEV92587.1 efflux RND transporter periplasmic adaptor subunit [Psychroflexus aurantiacus]